MRALILVDIQNDFLPGGALPVPQGNQILPAINALLNTPFDLVVATKDFHPANHVSFATSHGKAVGDVISNHGRDQLLWPTHCVQGTPGADFVNGWNTDKVDKIIYKGSDPQVDSYSAFIDNDEVKSTGLESYLRQHNITDIYIAGLATDYCVLYSVLDALKLGFNVYVVTDACRGVNVHPQDAQKAFETMKRQGAHLVTFEEVISA